MQAHTELGDGLLPWTIGLAVVSAAMAFLHVRASRTESIAQTGTPAGVAAGADRGSSAAVATAARPAVSPVLRIAVLLLGVVVAAGSCVQVYRIGESGSKAVWTGNFSTTSTQPGGGRG